MGVSLRAYARMRGCSLTAVQKAISSKRITTLPDGTIDAGARQPGVGEEHVRRADDP